MPKGRKLSEAQVEQVAIDRRNGYSWKKLSQKYKCAVNTLRSALSDYSDEFNPIRSVRRSELEQELKQTQSEIDKIKDVLRLQFGLHI